MTKRACLNVYNAFKGTNAKLIGQVHDELLMLVPGRWQAKVQNKKVEYVIDKEAQYYIDIAVKAMEKAEEYYFNIIAPGKGYTGKVSYEAGPYWIH